MSTTARDLCGVISALQTYEHYIIGSPHPVYLDTDHKRLLYFGDVEENYLINFSAINLSFHNSKT